MMVAAAHWILVQVSVGEIFRRSLCRLAFVLWGQIRNKKNSEPGDEVMKTRTVYTIRVI